MSLEEETIESAGDRCDVCGSALSEDEIAEALESDGPNICFACVDEQGLDGDDGDPALA